MKVEISVPEVKEIFNELQQQPQKFFEMIRCNQSQGNRSQQGKRMKFSAPDKICEVFIIPACYLSFSFDAGLA